MVTPPTHILVIEDDPVLAASLHASLEREGYIATLKDTGQAGIDHIRTHSPHLVLLDVRLPDLSGFDVCRQMRQLGLRQPIIRQKGPSRSFQCASVRFPTLGHLL